MKARHLLTIAVVALALATLWPAQGGSAQQGIMAIVHPSNSVESVSESRIRNIYLGRTRFWGDNTPVKPFARPPSTDAGRSLFRVLGMAPSRYRHHWQEKQLSGQGTAPRTVHSAPRAIAAVASNPGGISYVTQSEARQAGKRVRVVPIR